MITILSSTPRVMALLGLTLAYGSFAAVDTTTAPWTDLRSVPLSIARSNNNLTLTWAVTSPPLSVQLASNLPAANWEPVRTLPQMTNGTYQLTLTASNQSAFYRLGAAAVFVAPPPFGNDTNPGTQLQPLATLAQGLVVAAAQQLPVFVSKGVYSEPTLQVSSPTAGVGVSLYGQFDGTANWLRAMSNTTTIQSTDAAVLFSQVSGETHFEGFDVHATASQPDHSSYGILVSNPVAPVVLRFNSINVGDGVSGESSNPGADGAAGGDGGPGGVGACSSEMVALGGPGGASGATGPQANFGGLGGAGSYSQSNGIAGEPGLGSSSASGGVGGNWGNPGNAGSVGLPGAPVSSGTNGISGAGGSFNGLAWASANGSAGEDGTDGNGGGGGGGGGGRWCRFCAPGTGNGGGGGGGGGGAGTGASGSAGGGGSFGIVLLSTATNPLVVIDFNTITTGAGGAGGNGASGGRGGPGGLGGPGGNVCPTGVGVGRAGGNGSAGGDGGASGAGAGGPSIGIYGGLLGLIGTNNVFSIGPAGPGGTSPVGPGGTGQRAAVQ